MFELVTLELTMDQEYTAEQVEGKSLYMIQKGMGSTTQKCDMYANLEKGLVDHKQSETQSQQQVAGHLMSTYHNGITCI